MLLVWRYVAGNPLTVGILDKQFDESEKYYVWSDYIVQFEENKWYWNSFYADLCIDTKYDKIEKKVPVFDRIALALVQPII